MAKQNNKKINTVGLIGLGLMGQGIASCLIANRLRLVGYSRSNPGPYRGSPRAACRKKIDSPLADIRLGAEVRIRPLARGFEAMPFHYRNGQGRPGPEADYL